MVTFYNLFVNSMSYILYLEYLAYLLLIAYKLMNGFVACDGWMDFDLNNDSKLRMLSSISLLVLMITRGYCSEQIGQIDQLQLIALLNIGNFIFP